jgi:transposase
MALTPATQTTPYPDALSLYMAIELSASKWRVALSAGGQRIREKTIPAGDREKLLGEIWAGKKRFGLAEDAKVLSCYEAGRDGFWVDRLLRGLGVENVVIDAASIKVDRRARRAKTDKIDARQLLANLIRHHCGEKDVWRVVRVPSEEQEDKRRLHRDLERLKKEKTQHRARILSLLATQGVQPCNLKAVLAELDAVSIWNGEPLPPALKAEIKRERDRLRLVEDQIRAITRQQRDQLKQPSSPELRMIKMLAMLRGIGIDSAWILVMEFFAWREFSNRGQVGGAAGLGGTPYNSGSTENEQGINKAGNPLVRTRMVELAWLWIRLQPHSELSQWFMRRFAGGGSRMRRVGIVAVARKLLIGLWHLVEHGAVPRGAIIDLTESSAA